MPAETPTLVATSIGFPSRQRGAVDLRAGPVYRFAAGLARPTATPRMCLIATATGDSAESLVTAYTSLAHTGMLVSHLSLFPMPNVPDVRAHLLGQDLIWVGGGSVANLLAVWRAHGLEEILHECWQAGVVIGGVSAGSLCFHVGGTTDSFGLELRPVTNGLGWVPYANGVHYDSEAQRRPLLQRLIRERVLPDGYATDDGVGLVYRGTQLEEAVSQVAGRYAYRVERLASGEVRETQITPRILR